MKELHNTILKVVNQHSGIKGVDLVLQVMVHLPKPETFSTEDYFHALAAAIAMGDILELEYIIPTHPEKVKSIYFPKDTLLVSTMRVSETHDANLN